ncbi:hypothetical protein BDP67DRAFT_214285 [Colletotrichum lupini]|nr:hypothetical protein BDP67DRAFT_214285 [Colletotrichum lupini]
MRRKRFLAVLRVCRRVRGIAEANLEGREAGRVHEEVSVGDPNLCSRKELHVDQGPCSKTSPMLALRDLAVRSPFKRRRVGST